MDIDRYKNIGVDSGGSMQLELTMLCLALYQGEASVGSTHRHQGIAGGQRELRAPQVGMAIVDQSDSYGKGAVGEQAGGRREDRHRHRRGIDRKGSAERTLRRTARPLGDSRQHGVHTVGGLCIGNGRHGRDRHRVARRDAAHADARGREGDDIGGI